MLIYIIINILIIISTIVIDMWLHTFRQLRLSTLLIALTINSVINIWVIGKYDFISFSIIAFILIWTVLALLTDWNLHPIVFETQKFAAFIIFTLMSVSFFIIFNTSEDSYYMSIPYLSPVFFLMGASLLFLSIFQNSDAEKNNSSKKLRNKLTIGTILIVLSFMVMTLLTPFWYIFVVIYLILIAFILWMKIF